MTLGQILWFIKHCDTKIIHPGIFIFKYRVPLKNKKRKVQIFLKKICKPGKWQQQTCYNK